MFSNLGLPKDKNLSPVSQSFMVTILLLSLLKHYPV